MSVFTELDAGDVEQFLAHYEVGGYRGHTGLPGGVENSNFRVATERGEYVLTVFERQPAHDAAYTLAFMHRCRGRGLPVPTVLFNRDRDYLSSLCDRPAALCSYLHGRHVDRPNVEQCHAVGRALARLHAVGPGSARPRANPYGNAWCNQVVTRVVKYLDARQRDLLQAALSIASTFGEADLPRGIIHADLFRDNVLFDGNELVGLLDFHYACEGQFVLDLAIAMNDWCSTPTGRLSGKRRQALLDGYAQLRVLDSGEAEALPAALVPAALRFWLSRLEDFHFPRAGSDVEIKPPHEFEQRLANRIRAF